MNSSQRERADVIEKA